MQLNSGVSSSQQIIVLSGSFLQAVLSRNYIHVVNVWIGYSQCGNNHGREDNKIFQDEFRESLPKSSNILITTSKQVSDSSPTTSNLIYLIKVMPSAFWSFSSKLIANKKYVKEGLNRLHMLLVSLPNGSRVTSTLSSKLYQFPVFAYNGRIIMFLYLVNTF
ncbi:hypothetical protein ISN45_Aa07g033050 [Arabidopsis thaliana x Arabidopsis arenosa]|uniref:Uncharacterized protein n=1 Tax=Arabidopsis thaliana x Arabidopsis arenosa TaxID=1240361 RepID=A0A8T1Y8Q7_9BRAS|nr:hypothetical protein ISN45_Aa07g033050 [Arabidopsis thaliana x Arabidopsis arenosa]